MPAGMRKGPGLRRLSLAGMGLTILFTAIPSFHEGAFAQEVVRRRGLLDLLFGGPPAREDLPAVREERAPARQGTPRRRSAPARTAPATPVDTGVDKLDNARVVLVVGDFLAGGLAEGLESAYAQSPGVRIVDHSNGSSGFVRDDFYDWNAQIGPILEDVDPAVVVTMIGSNDRQQLLVDGRRERPQSEAWVEEYSSRVTNFAETITDAGIPLVWAGLPPFKSSSMSSDMLAFNDIHKQAVEAVGGTFVDIWEGFVDENGAFTYTGPDINGQPVKLRGSDGINLTRPARRKVAFYVEKPLNKLLGNAALPDIGQGEMANLPLPGLPGGEPSTLNRTQPVSLATPALAETGELLGAKQQPSPFQEEKNEGEEQQQARNRKPEEPPYGRADDFSLARKPYDPGSGDEVWPTALPWAAQP